SKDKDPIVLINLEVSLARKALLVEGEQLHSFVGTEKVRFNRSINLCFQSLDQFSRIVLSHGQYVTNTVAGNLFFDVEPTLFILIEENVDFIDSPKKIVNISHDVLVGAG